MHVVISLTVYVFINVCMYTTTDHSISTGKRKKKPHVIKTKSLQWMPASATVVFVAHASNDPDFGCCCFCCWQPCWLHSLHPGCCYSN